jgi:hypothetical protein
MNGVEHETARRRDRLLIKERKRSGHEQILEDKGGDWSD